VGRETSGKSKGGRSSTGVNVGAGEAGFVEGEGAGLGEACSLEPEIGSNAICCERCAGGVMDDEKMAAARARVSRPSEVTGVVGVAPFLPLGKGDDTGEANSLEDSVSDVVDVLQQQSHTSPHWQGFSREETFWRG